jgi:hypothetical protein
MATNDTSPGLLSKMAQFVRHPTKDWSALEAQEPPQESGFSKQALKEMIERKRQNDFVRRREFDYLRKLRRNGLKGSTELASHSSFFQNSSSSNLDERAITLKKIDEIEAHMSKQWWRSKQAESAQLDATSRKVDVARLSQDVTAEDEALTQPATLSAAQGLAQDDEYESTKMGLVSPDDSLARMDSQQALTRQKKGPSHEAAISEFATSQLFSSGAGANLANPELEEAAIRFANGDDAGAEAGLLAALQAPDLKSALADGWVAALFDLYRGTGQQAAFDSLAIDYALRFGRSAPAWFSTPELLGLQASSAGAGSQNTPETAGPVLWESPACLDLSALQTLLAIPTDVDVPLHLNWRRLSVISPEAGQGLALLFAEWCLKSFKLLFIAPAVLDRILKSLTPSGDKQVAVFWWKLRLDALRLLHRQDEFELAALDFCVTYEVSPPPWIDARCELVPEPAALDALSSRAHKLSHHAAPDEPLDFGQASTLLMSTNTMPASVVELCGEVLGDAAEAMDKLQACAMGSNRLVISCLRLIRVDFSAAGSILNWVAVHEAQGCHVQFREVPRLVAAFFNVIGINEHARVFLRDR